MGLNGGQRTQNSLLICHTQLPSAPRALASGSYYPWDEPDRLWIARAASLPGTYLHTWLTGIPTPFKPLLTTHMFSKTALIMQFKILAFLSHVHSSCPMFCYSIDYCPGYLWLTDYAPCFPSWLEAKLLNCLYRNSDREGVQEKLSGWTGGDTKSHSLAGPPSTQHVLL